jgi:nucleolar protein 16
MTGKQNFFFFFWTFTFLKEDLEQGNRHKMARPRVRRKTRNPSQKVSRKQKHPMRISFAGVHHLVQENWDKAKTLTENYEALGLIPKLMGSAGGQGAKANALYAMEKERLSAQTMPLDVETEIEWRVIDRSSEGSSEPSASSITVTAAQEDEIEPVKFIDDQVTALGAKVNLKRLRHIRLDGKGPSSDSSDSSTPKEQNPIIAAMEDEAKTVVQIIRQPSGHEELVLSALERKHGQDFKAMARDLKLNKYQFTPGQLKKKFQRVALKQSGISRVLKDNSMQGVC